MKQIRIKMAVVVGLLFLATESFAASISWVSNHAVPMSNTSMIIMMSLFLIIGLMMLSKTKKQTQSLLLALALVTGVYNFTAEAVGNPDVLLDSASGTKELPYGQSIVRNTNVDDIRITALDLTPPVGAPNLRDTSVPCEVGTVLSQNQECYVNIGSEE